MEQFRYRKISKEEEETTDNLILHDYKGNRYVVSEEWFINQWGPREWPDNIQKEKARKMIFEEFKMLTKKQQEVMKLVVKGISLRAIAKTLKINYSSVRDRKKAAVKKLRNYIPSIQGE